MWRGVIFAAVLTAAGHPRLDGYRPALIDRTLQQAYRDFTRVATSGAPAEVLDCSRVLQQVSAALDRFNRSLRI